MAYKKQTFKDNETVLKAEHLDHIEYGIVSSAELDEEHIAHFKNCLGVVLFSMDLSGLGVPLEYGDLVLSAESLTIAEGGSGTFTVKLASAPSVKQTVYLALSDNTKLSVFPASLVFTPDNWATEQTVTLTAAQDDDEYDDSIIVTLTSKNVDGKSLIVTVSDDDKPVLVTDGLVFNIELRGRTAENDAANPPTIVDTVNGLTCTPYNIDWDGENSGFVENGLLLKPYSLITSPNQYNEKTYSVLGVPKLPDVDFTNGITIECCTALENGALLRFYNGMSNGKARYLSINPGSAQSYAQGFINTDGGDNVGSYVVFGDAAFWYNGTGFKTGEHIFTYTYSPNGILSHYLDGVLLGQTDYNMNGDFDRFFLPDVLQTMEAGYIGNFENGANDRRMVISEYRTYNRVLSADEIVENYKFTVAKQTATNF